MTGSGVALAASTMRERLESERKAREAAEAQLAAVTAQLAAREAEIQAWAAAAMTEHAALQEQHNQLLRSKSAAGPATATESSGGAGEIDTSPTALLWMGMMKESFEGDYVAARHDSMILHEVADAGDNVASLIFCDLGQKVGRSATNDRFVLLTAVSVLLIDTDSKTLSRRLKIAELEFVTVSRMHAGMVALHHTREHDMLLIVPKRAEFLYFLIKLYWDLTGKRLPYKEAERFHLRDADGKRELEVFATQKYRQSRTKFA